jgi:outer membrane protein TolC
VQYVSCRLAGQVYGVNLDHYELRLLLYSDVLDVEKSRADAENNLLSATYERLVVSVRWQRAGGE